MDERTAAYWDDCARLATELRRQAAEMAEMRVYELSDRAARQLADNLRMLELALWTASAECRWREAAERGGGAG